jgi:hypothetical protein
MVGFDDGLEIHNGKTRKWVFDLKSSMLDGGNLRTPEGKDRWCKRMVVWDWGLHEASREYGGEEAMKRMLGWGRIFYEAPYSLAEESRRLSLSSWGKSQGSPKRKKINLLWSSLQSRNEEGEKVTSKHSGGIKTVCERGKWGGEEAVTLGFAHRPLLKERGRWFGKKVVRDGWRRKMGLEMEGRASTWGSAMEGGRREWERVSGEAAAPSSPSSSSRRVK